MTRLLILTGGELTRDPRARRQVSAALTHGLEVAGLSATVGEETAPLEDIPITRVRINRMSTAVRRTGLGGPSPSRPVIREARGAVRAVRLVLSTLRLVRAGRQLDCFDVVHANDFVTLPAAWLLTRRWRARLVFDAHELYAREESDGPRIYRRVVTLLEGPLARRADAVVTVSEPLAAELRRRLGLQHDPVVVLNCPSLTSGDPTRPAGGGIRAVYQGALGPDRPIAALLTAAEHAPSVDITIRVTAPTVSVLTAEIERRKLGDRVRAVEPVSPDRLVDALYRFDVGVIFNSGVTAQHTYALPNRLFEYMMAGLAVVAPHTPAIAPIIQREEIGITYPFGNQQALGAALEDLARDPARVAEMGARARRCALARFNAEAESERLVRAWGSAASVRPIPEHAPA